MANITKISPTLISNQLDYSLQDENLILSFEVNTTLSPTSYIEYSIYNLSNDLLFNTYTYSSYTVKNDGQSSLNSGVSSIEINPDKDLEFYGYNQGAYNVYYNILSRKIGSNLQTLFISEISSDRTEIRLVSNNIESITLEQQISNLISERDISEYFLDFYLNFGNNDLVIANNIQLDDIDSPVPSAIIKLYEPLPNNYDIKSELWVVTSIDESLAYNVEFEEELIIINDSISLKGPNFNLDLKDQVNNSTLNLSYSDIVKTTLSSSTDQLNSLLEEKELSINIDYNNFSNFIHFSSGENRLENFAYKVGLIEQYSSSISTLNSNITGPTSESIDVNGSKTIFKNKISSIITNFDHYEYALYYDSSSYAWPKTNLSPPFLLHKTGSTEALEWLGSANENNTYYGGQLLSSSRFDDENKDNLVFSIPEFLREDPENKQYELFINMVAQHYDNIWI